MKNLVVTWLEAESINGKNQSQAVREMNRLLGTKYTPSRISEWRDGRRVPSGAAMNYMLSIAVGKGIYDADPATLKKSDDPLRFLVRARQALTLPKKKPR